METEQPIYSNPPKKHLWLDNPSTIQELPLLFYCIIVFLLPSEFVLVPSEIPLELQVDCHQDLEYDWDLEYIVSINWHEKNYAHVDAV